MDPDFALHCREDYHCKICSRSHVELNCNKLHYIPELEVLIRRFQRNLTFKEIKRIKKASDLEN